MTRYLSLIRGINVGGNNIVKMADLRAALEQDGFEEVSSYIQSGNVFFSSTKKSASALSKKVAACLKKHFKVDTQVVTFSAKQWQDIVKKAPKEWGKKADWKHNLLIMMDAKRVSAVIEAAGEIKPDIEAVTAGKGVLYQSVSIKGFGRSSFSKLPSQPIYKEMTIRNYRTALKIQEGLEKADDSEPKP